MNPIFFGRSMANQNKGIVKKGWGEKCSMGMTHEKLKELLSKKLHEKFSQEWSASISSQTGSLRFYKTFKSDFAREKYLDFINCYKLRRVISKFRCSDHKLEIEIGRRKKVVENERRCQVCMNDVESEVHFLANCPPYQKLRLKYFGINIQGNITDIMKCSTRVASFNLANYLSKAYDIKGHCLKIMTYFV